MIYPLILIAVLLLAIWRGWRRGMVRQLASLLGLAFGFVAARMFYVQAAGLMDPFFPGPERFAEAPFGEPLRYYTLYMVSATAVFMVAYALLRLLGTVLESAMQLIDTGAINSILGAGFSFCKWVVVMSVAFNLWLVVKPDCGLLRYCNDGDGNVVELVMCVAPALFGTESPAELEHYNCLRRARQLGLD